MASKWGSGEEFSPYHASRAREGADGMRSVSVAVVRRQLEIVLRASALSGGLNIGEVGQLDERRGQRAAGTVYADGSVASASLLGAVRATLFPIAALSFDEWRYGWRPHGDDGWTIRIYPQPA